MTVLHKIDLDLKPQPYSIHIGTGLLQRAADFVPLDLKGRTLFIVTDESIAATHATTLVKSLQDAGAAAVHMKSLPSGEGTKSYTHLESVLTWMLEHRVDRHAVLFAVGGGVIGDLGGFAASIVMRGIPFVQVPTTLLAQVDSSVGGKTGINTPQGKNLVGAFYQPISVICDLDTLQTLPRRELLAGYAEIVKYGLIDDEPFFAWLEQNGHHVCALDHNALSHAIAVSCRKKADVVEQDEKEQGLRALLNLGHTFGHALEGIGGYDGRLLHGEAVSIGMVLAFKLSALLGLCKVTEVDRVVTHLSFVGLPVTIPAFLNADVARIMSYMGRDKKTERGNLVFILARGIGQSFIARDVAAENVETILSHSLEQQGG